MYHLVRYLYLSPWKKVVHKDRMELMFHLQLETEIVKTMRGMTGKIGDMHPDMREKVIKTKERGIGHHSRLGEVVKGRDIIVDITMTIIKNTTIIHQMMAGLYHRQSLPRM